MSYQVNEKDWKLFRKVVPIWQESYMEKLVEVYNAILSQDKKASDKFWELEERIKKDRKNPGVILEMSRSKMLGNLVILLNTRVIEMKDLEEFSDELKEVIEMIN